MDRFCRERYISRLKEVCLVVSVARLKLFGELGRECYREAFDLAYLLVDSRRELGLGLCCLANLVVQLVVTKSRLEQSQPFWQQVVTKAGCPSLAGQRYWLLEYLPGPFLLRMLWAVAFMARHRDYPGIEGLLVRLVALARRNCVENWYRHDEGLEERLRRGLGVMGDGQDWWWEQVEAEPGWRGVLGLLFCQD